MNLVISGLTRSVFTKAVQFSKKKDECSVDTGIVIVGGLSFERGGRQREVRVALGRVRAQRLARPAQLAALAALHRRVAAVHLRRTRLMYTIVEYNVVIRICLRRFIDLPGGMR